MSRDGARRFHNMCNIIAIIHNKPTGIISKFNHDLGSPIWPSKLLSTENCSFLQNSTLGKFCVLVYVRRTMSVTKTCGSSGIHGAAAGTVTSWNWVESCVYVRPTWKTGVKWWISLPHINIPTLLLDLSKVSEKLGGCSHDKLTANKRTMTWCHQNGSNSAFALNHLYLYTHYTHGWPSKLNLSQHDLRLQWKYGKVIIRKQYVAVTFQHLSPIFLCQSGGLSRTQLPKSINYSLLCVTIGCSASPLPDARHHRDPRLLDIYWPFIVEILCLHLPSKGRWRRQERRWLVGLRSSCQQGAMFLRRKECALHSWLTFFGTFMYLWNPLNPQIPKNNSWMHLVLMIYHRTYGYSKPPSHGLWMVPGRSTPSTPAMAQRKALPMSKHPFQLQRSQWLQSLPENDGEWRDGGKKMIAIVCDDSHPQNQMLNVRAVKKAGKQNQTSPKPNIIGYPHVPTFLEHLQTVVISREYMQRMSIWKWPSRNGFRATCSRSESIRNNPAQNASSTPNETRLDYIPNLSPCLFLATWMIV